MSFKEEYSRYQQTVSPNKDFLNELAEKMEQQKQQGGKKKTKTHVLILSAAAMCSGAAAAVIILLNTGTAAVKPPDNVNMGAVTADKIGYVTGIFSEEEIFQNERDIPKQLAQILSEENTVLYKSDKNTFDYDGKQEKEARENLATAIENAVETEELPEGGSTDYYMAVDENGNVVKFRISGEFLIIGEKNYKLS